MSRLHFWNSPAVTIRVYSNCYCSCSFEAEIIKIGQSSYKIYSNNILNFQESTTILNACTKKVWKPIEGTPYIQLFDDLIGKKQIVAKCCWFCLSTILTYIYSYVLLVTFSGCWVSWISPSTSYHCSNLDKI